MKSKLAVCILLTCAGCASTPEKPPYPISAESGMQLNYTMLQPNIVGQSSGFSLLGLIPISVPSYTRAWARLSAQTKSFPDDKRIRYANVVQDRSFIYLILFSVPTKSVRADLVRFDQIIPEYDDDFEDSRQRSPTAPGADAESTAEQLEAPAGR